MKLSSVIGQYINKYKMMKPKELAELAKGGDAEALSQTIKYATIMVATVPILCVYPFLQKYFATGVMIGAVKE